MGKPVVILLVGLPGVGKTTLARQIAPVIGAVVLNRDEMRDAIFPEEFLDYSREQNQVGTDALFGVLGYLLARPRPPFIIVDGKPFSRRSEVEHAKAVVEQADARPLQRLGQHEGEFRLDARHAVIRVRHLRAVMQHHVVEQMAVVRLVDLRRLLHCLRGQADLVTEQLAAAGDLAARRLALNRVGILDLDIRKGFGQLHGLHAGPLGFHQNIRGPGALLVGQHGSAILPVDGILELYASMAQLATEYHRMPPCRKRGSETPPQRAVRRGNASTA